MKCYSCDGTFEEKNDLLEIDDPYVGKISVLGIPYYQCSSCGELLYTEEMSLAIEAKRNNQIQKYLNNQPISGFISSADTASILGISRQALHKNKRINRGFIYQTTFSGFIVYLKKSVLQYKNSGDGRFPLVDEHNPNYVFGLLPQYLVNNESKDSSLIYGQFQGTKVSSDLQLRERHAGVKESIYAK